MDTDETISLEEFLDKKEDYSNLLVHLTRSDETASASDILSCILCDSAIRAYHAFCVWKKDLEKPDSTSLRKNFNVVCFTETPLDQIQIVLQRIEYRLYQPEPYGLVFRKSYIQAKGGNPVFYVTKEIVKPLHELFKNQLESPDSEACRLLALTTLCEKKNDWHWEREWRVVGDLLFKLEDIYCGLCPEREITDFAEKFKPVKFIDPYWSKKRIIDELVKQELVLDNYDDIPF